MQGDVLRGRALTEADNEHSHWVALVNQAMVRRYFSGKLSADDLGLSY